MASVSTIPALMAQYQELQQINAALSQISGGTLISTMTLASGLVISTPVPAGDTIYTRLNNFLTARQTSLQNTLAAAGFTSP